MSEGGEAELMTPGRLEAFSDGVFAIAVTLLILEVKASGEGPLSARLGHAWPSYMAYATSFFVIGTMWINHHAMFHALKAVDHTIIVANLALLLVISFIPFPTQLVGEYLAAGTNADARSAALLFGATSMLAGIAFPLLWWAIIRNPAFLKPHMTPQDCRSRMRRNLLGFPTYTVVTLIALLSPLASVIGAGLVALFYLLPERTKVLSS